MVMSDFLLVCRYRDGDRLAGNLVPGKKSGKADGIFKVMRRSAYVESR